MLITLIRRSLHLYETEVKVKEFPRRIFSGIQPTGTLHIGNYLGAVKPWLQLQKQNEDMLISIVDLHSITLPHNPKLLSRNILEMTATLLACGIKPEKTILFQQSKVPQHTELCWELGCISTMARLAHLPQFKEKSAHLKDVPLGLFMYPVLQAADILLYKATNVPVGEDQLQHLQLAQELAKMFNSRYGETFPIPRSMVSGDGKGRLKSLRSPDKKMSKSDEDSKSRISLINTPDEIRRKIKKAVTDCTSELTYDPIERPGVSNLLTIHSELCDKSIEKIIEENGDRDTGKYKLWMAEEIAASLEPISCGYYEYMNNPDYLESVLKDGAERASQLAGKTMKEVRKKLGLDFRFQNYARKSIKQ